MNDTAEKVRFELASGTVRAAGGERLVLMPCSALEELAKKMGVEVACELGRAMGAAFGKAVAERLGSSDSVQASSLETVVNELGSELAVAGWGVIGLERWGRAMVMTVNHSPFTEPRFVAAILQGALGAAAGRDVQCWPLGGNDAGRAAEGSIRILVAGQRGIGRARELLAQGVSWGDVLVRLQRGPSVTVQERIAKLEALLVRVSTRAAEPRNGHAVSAFVPDAPAFAAAPSVAQASPFRAPAVTVVTPAVAIMPTSVPVVHVPEEPEEIELGPTDLISSPPPPLAEAAPPAVAAAEVLGDEPLESRERLVAAPAVDEMTDVQSLPPVREEEERDDRPSDPTAVVMAPPVLEVASDDAPDVEVSTSELLGDDGGVVDVDMEAEEPPASSRRPIAIEPPLAELAFGDAAPPPAAHTPPPESGRQVSASAYPEAAQPAESLGKHPEAPEAAVAEAGLDFDGESTGVGPKADVEAAHNPSPTSPPPAPEVQVASGTTPAPKTVPPPATRTAPPPTVTPTLTAVATLSPEVVQPSLDAAANVVAFVGKAPEFQPSSFGDLLDATLAL